MYITQKIIDGYNSADNQQTSFLYRDDNGYAIYDVTGTCNSQQVWNVTMTQRGTGNSNTITIVPDGDGFASTLLPLGSLELNITLYQMNASQSVLLLIPEIRGWDTGQVIYSSDDDFNGMPSDGWVWLKDDPSQPVTPWVSFNPQSDIDTARIYIKIYDINNPSQICQNINVKINMGSSYVYETNTSDWSNGIIDYTCPLNEPPDQITIEIYGNTYYQGTTVAISKTQYNGQTYSIGLIPKSTPTPTPTTYTVNVDVVNNNNQPLEGVAIAVDNLTSTNTNTTTSPSANTNTTNTNTNTSNTTNTNTNPPLTPTDELVTRLYSSSPTIPIYVDKAYDCNLYTITDPTDNTLIKLIPTLPDGTVLNNAQITVLKNYNIIYHDNVIPTIPNTGAVCVTIRRGEKYLFTAQLDGYTFDQLNLIVADPNVYYIYGVQNPVQVNKGSIYPMMLMTLPNMRSNLNETYCEMYYKGATVSCEYCDYAWHDYILYDSTCKPYTYIVPQSAVNSLLTQGTLTGPWNGLIPFGTANWTPSQIGIVQLALAPSTPWGPVLIFETSPLPEQIIAIQRYLYIPSDVCQIQLDYNNGYVTGNTTQNLFNGTSMSTMQPITTRPLYGMYGDNGPWSAVSWGYVITFSDNSLMGIGPFTSTTSLPSNLQYVYPLSSIPSCKNYNTSIPSWLYSG